MKQIRKFVREKGAPEADGTGQAVQEVRGCDYPSCLFVKLAPVPDTGKNGGNGQVMELSPEKRFRPKTRSFHGISESKQGQPSLEEVRSSVRILDFHRKEVTCGNSATWLCILCRPHGMWHSGTGLRMIMTGLMRLHVPDRNRHKTRGWHWKAACAGMRKRQQASGMSVCRIST